MTFFGVITMLGQLVLVAMGAVVIGTGLVLLAGVALTLVGVQLPPLE